MLFHEIPQGKSALGVPHLKIIVLPGLWLGFVAFVKRPGIDPGLFSVGLAFPTWNLSQWSWVIYSFADRLSFPKMKAVPGWGLLSLSLHTLWPGSSIGEPADIVDPYLYLVGASTLVAGDGLPSLLRVLVLLPL